MAVFTVISDSEFNDWGRRRFGFGRVDAPQPISDGIENTNYRVRADGSDYVFTIFELWDADAVRYYTALMRHFERAGLPVPAAVAPAGHSPVLDWHGKPCVLVPFIGGAPVSEPDAAQCAAFGDLLARLHIAAADFEPQRPNPRGRRWRAQAAAAIRDRLNSDLRQLADMALAADEKFSRAPLPAAACHCDMFRNNVLWDSGVISAVIDFYFGGQDALLFDLAVAACDWCTRDGRFSPPLLAGLLGGYNRRRRLCDLEQQLFPDALNSAAVRFWLSRRYDIAYPRRARILRPHDPTAFENILRTIRNDKQTLMQLAKKAAA